MAAEAAVIERAVDEVAVAGKKIVVRKGNTELAKADLESPEFSGADDADHEEYGVTLDVSLGSMLWPEREILFVQISESEVAEVFSVSATPSEVD